MGPHPSVWSGWGFCDHALLRKVWNFVGEEPMGTPPYRVGVATSGGGVARR